MKGSVRTRERCPVCGGSFTLQIIGTMPGLYCERGCRTVPRRYWVDARTFKRYAQRSETKPETVGPLTRDDRGVLLHSYFQAAGLLEAIRHDYNRDPSKFSASKWSRSGRQSRKFADVWEAWIATIWRRYLAEKNNLDAHYASTERMGRLHILPEIGQVQLGRDDGMELTHGVLEALNFTLSDKGLKASTRQSILKRIKTCLRYAREEKIIGFDDLPRFPKIPREVRDVEPTTREVQLQIRALMPVGTRLMVDVLSETGMRFNEVCGLKKMDVRPDGKISIQRGLSRRRREALPKNGKRTVDISPELHRTLMALPAINDAYLFRTYQGQPYTSDVLGRAFRRAARKAGYNIPPVVAFRHSLATTLKREGMARLDEESAAAIGDTVAVARTHYIRTDAPLAVGRRRKDDDGRGMERL